MKRIIFLMLMSIIVSCNKKENNLIDNNTSFEIKDTKKKKKSSFICVENISEESRYDDPLNRTCHCNESSFKKGYIDFYNELPDYINKLLLLKQLPIKDTIYSKSNSEIEYNISSDSLKINIGYEGGDIKYIFYKNTKKKLNLRNIYTYHNFTLKS